MTSNEEIYNLSKARPKVCIPWGVTISSIAPKRINEEQETENYEIENENPELQAEMDEANLWNF